MTSALQRLTLMIGLLLGSAASCEELEGGQALKGQNLEGAPLGDVSGTVVDQTLTVFGHEFSRFFATAWLDNPEFAEKNLVIFERPSAAWGNLLWIEHNYQMVYRTFLGPRRTDLKAMADQAVAVVSGKIVSSDINELIIDPDLAKDELSKKSDL